MLLFQVVSFCEGSLNTPDAAFALRITLTAALGISRIRIKILRMLLNILFQQEDRPKISEAVENDIVGQYLLHLDHEPKLSSSQLQELITIGQNEIKSSTVFKSKWFPIMSKLISLCLDHEKMPQLSDDHEISGSEFR